MVAPSKRYEKGCKSCPALVRNDSKSGYCAACVKGSPEFRAKVAAAARARNTPEYRAKVGEGVRQAGQRDPSIRARKSAAMRKLAATPEWQERNREQCTRRRLWEKGVAARTPESNAKAGRTFSERYGVLSWCPARYADLARRMLHNQPLADVRAHVERLVLREHLPGLDLAAAHVAIADRCPVMRAGDGLWRYGNGTRTDDEILAMALRKGWDGYA